MASLPAALLWLESLKVRPGSGFQETYVALVRGDDLSPDLPFKVALGTTKPLDCGDTDLFLTYRPAQSLYEKLLSLGRMVHDTPEGMRWYP